MAFQQSLVEAITGSKQELVLAGPHRLFVAIRCCVVDEKMVISTSSIPENW